MVSESASVIRKMSLSDRRAPSVSSSLSALAAAPVQGKSAESGSRPLSATSPNVPPPPPPPQLLSRGGSHSQLHDVASSPSNSPSSTTNIPSATNNNNLFFSKSSTHTPPLPSPIRRIAYIK